MRLNDRIKSAYASIFIPDKKNDDKRTKGMIVTRDDDRALEIVNASVKQFMSALNESNNIIYPDRVKFIQYLKLAFLDPQVSNCLDIRRTFVDNDLEIVDSKGNEIKSLKSVFEDYDGETCHWFNEFILNIHDSILTGHTLQQLGVIGKGGKPTTVERIKDEYLLTPWEMCRESIDFGFTKTFNVVDYNDPKYASYVVSVINREPNGILPKIMNQVIYKQVQVNWRAFLETSGRDILAIKTNLSDETRKKNAETSLKSLDKGSRIVAHTDDIIEILQSSNSSAGQDGYQLLMKQCDRYIAGVLIGSDLTEEKSFVGAMEVQERILKAIQKRDMRIIARTVNNCSALKKLGILPEGTFMRWKMDDVVSVENTIKLLQTILPIYDITPEELEKYVKLKIGNRVKNEPVKIETNPTKK